MQNGAEFSDQSLVLKIIVAGSTGVGKTTLIRKYVDGIFDTDTQSTIGVDFSLKSVYDLDKKYIFQLWDMGGEERFRTILPSYIPGTQAAILCFEAPSPLSLNELNEWIEVLLTNSEYPDLPLLLISTKNDIKQFNHPRIIKAFRKKHPNIIAYIPTSSQEGTNIDNLFQILKTTLIKKLDS